VAFVQFDLFMGSPYRDKKLSVSLLRFRAPASTTPSQVIFPPSSDVEMGIDLIAVLTYR
jgi:hypothetical protein